MPVPGADQGEAPALRQGAPQPLAGERAAQIGGERRALADGVDPGFFARMGGHRRDIAGGKDLRVGRRAQGLVDRDKAALGQRQPGLGEPRGGTRLGHPQGFVERDAPAVGAEERSRLDAGDRAAGQQVDAALGENPLEQVAHPTIVRGQQRVAR